MRACNLETGKFEKYMQTLMEKGFVMEVLQNGGRMYRASWRGLDIVRNEKLAEFVSELP
jgi:predicted transcriptional regulator